MNELAHVRARHSKHQEDSKTIFGFWVYLMTDCVLFATLFATFVVLQNRTNGGPAGSELFSLPFVLTETLILLTSSFVCGLAVLAAHRRATIATLTWLGITWLLGAAFLAMELNEFHHLVAEGHSWQHSAFLSAFFTLVGTHGLHITVGLTWLAILAMQIIRRGFNRGVIRRLSLFALFWHFLDIVWIFIFSVVYLLGFR